MKGKTKKPNAATRKAAAKKADKTVATNQKLARLLLIDGFPCGGCLVLKQISDAESDPNYAFHMHLGCIHAMATRADAYAKNLEAVGGEMNAAAAALTKAAEPEKKAFVERDPNYG